MHRFWESRCEHLGKAWFCLQQPSWTNCFGKRSEMLWFTQCGSEFYLFGQESSLTGNTFWNHMIRAGQHLSLQRRWFFKGRGRKEWLYDNNTCLIFIFPDISLFIQLQITLKNWCLHKEQLDVPRRSQDIV